jgi:hypothetical protein
MKQKLRLFAIHQAVTSLQRRDNLNPRTRWYPALDESNRTKSAYFTIRPGKNPPPQNGCRLISGFFFQKHRFHILHFPNSTGLFTKPTGRHYTKHRFSPDIAPSVDLVAFIRWHSSVKFAGLQELDRQKAWGPSKLWFVCSFSSYLSFHFGLGQNAITVGR